MVRAPFADFTWRHARQLLADQGRDDTSETAIARALDDLLTRCERGPGGRNRSPRRAARPTSRPAHTGHRLEPGDEPRQGLRVRIDTAVPFGIFDAAAEAERWI